VLNRKWTADEDKTLRQVVNSCSVGDVIPWSYGKMSYRINYW